MATNKGIDIILIHQPDIEKDGCPLSLIIEKASTELHVVLPSGL